MKHPVGLKAKQVLLPNGTSFEKRAVEEVYVAEEANERHSSELRGTVADPGMVRMKRSR